MNELANLVWCELEAVDLIPDKAHFEAARLEVSHWGVIERKRAVSLVGQATWQRALDKLGRANPEDDCIRVLGFGHALTEFAIAPLHLRGTENDSVVSLGALANFIVATYDQFVDLDMNRNTPLPRWVLELSTRNENWLTFLGFMGFADFRMMARLVKGYFQDLKQLPYSKKHSYIHEYIKKSILRMYDAENLTLRTNKNLLDESTFQIKSAFPFVIMGLPAWLGIPVVNQRRYLWHIQWLYQLGEFFGWIDDVVDLEEDIRMGRSNRVLNAQLMLKDRNEKVELARMIAHRGKWIIAEWQRHICDADALPSDASEVFSTCVCSWFGGLPSAKLDKCLH